MEANETRWTPLGQVTFTVANAGHMFICHNCVAGVICVWFHFALKVQQDGTGCIAAQLLSTFTYKYLPL
jgi:hypothetical protein